MRTCLQLLYHTIFPHIEYLLCDIYCMARSFRGTKFSRIGHWQRLCENIFAVRWSQSHAHTGCMLTTPTSYVKVQWWRASLVLKRWCVDTILMKISGPCQSVRYYRHWATAWRSPFPFVNRLFSMLFTPALAKTMEDIGTFVDREPVGSGSFGSLSTLLK